jgi:hypothetical protein
MPAREIAARLASRCEDLFFALVPDCTLQGNELRGHGPDGGVWSIVIRGNKRGVFANWLDPERQAGDCLELIHWAMFPDETARQDSYRWALRWLGLAGGSSGPPEARVAYRGPPPVSAEESARARARAAQKARGRYAGGSIPFAESGALFSYLTSARGLPVGELGEPLHALRFSERQFYDAAHGTLPAMVAPIVDPQTRHLTGVHVTYLARVAGIWRNVQLAPRRKVFGAKEGGVIPLLRGTSGKRLPVQGEAVLIGEGIENTLAAALCCGDIAGLPAKPRAWAAVDLGNFRKLRLPPELETVLFVHDRDDERFRPYRDAVADEWREEGRTVVHLETPAGCRDFNDYVARLAFEN